MKLERTKNAARNVVFDGMMEMVNVLFPFVIRSVMLHYLGKLDQMQSDADYYHDISLFKHS